MRIIVESDGEDDYFEIALSEEELKAIHYGKGTGHQELIDFLGFRNVNVFIRKLNIGE